MIEGKFITIIGATGPAWQRTGDLATDSSLEMLLAIQRALYESAVRKVWESILIGRATTPRVLVNFLGRHPIIIVPARPQHDGSVTVPVSALDATALDNIQRACSAGNGLAAGAPLPDAGRGTGLGSEVVIFFTPERYKDRTEPGAMAHEVLFHELVHAMRMTTGNNQCREWGGAMGTEEEVIAIAITNMYASELGRPLRKDHNGFTKMIDRDAWLNQHQVPLIRLWGRQPQLCNALAAVRSPYNPFQELAPGP